MEAKKWIRASEWTNKEIELINPYLFLTSKPVIYLVNMSAKDYERKKNKWLPKIAAWIKEHVPGQMVPYSAEFEQDVLAKGGEEYIKTLKPEDAQP